MTPGTMRKPVPPPARQAPKRRYEHQEQKQRRWIRAHCLQPQPPATTPVTTTSEAAAGLTEVWSTVAKRGSTHPKPTGETATRRRTRPAAIVVKCGEGRTYSDTVRAVRSTDVNFDELGTHVTAIEKTRSGDLLVELTKGPKAESATASIKQKLAQSIPNAVITQLRTTTELEIVDLDEAATKMEVFLALKRAINGRCGFFIQYGISVTGIWPRYPTKWRPRSRTSGWDERSAACARADQTLHGASDAMALDTTPGRAPDPICHPPAASAVLR